MSAAPAAASLRPIERRMPPVTEVGAASMIAIALLAVAAALQVVNWVLLSRIRPFAWARFFQVARWTLLAYAVIAGMIEFAFLYDHTRGVQLVLMTLMLALFMLNVPVLVAFTVARYQAVEP